jgi:hypothetical protein
MRNDNSICCRSYFHLIDFSVDVTPIPRTDEAEEVRGVIFGTIPVGIFVAIEESLSGMTTLAISKNVSIFIKNNCDNRKSWN